MGKHGQQKKSTKNIFKVAGSKALKTKHKPKPVAVQLKKLTEITKKKTVDVDKQLTELYNEVRSRIKQINAQSMIVVNNHEKDTGKDKINKFKETEQNTMETLLKLSKLEV